MSWDISILRLPDSAASIDDLSNDFKPQPLGPRAEVIAEILKLAPDVDFRDPSWGMLNRESFSIEFNMGAGDLCESFMLHVRGGGDDVIHFIDQLLQGMKLQGFDCQSGELFTSSSAEETFAEWQEFRDQVVGGSASPGD